MVSCLSHYGLLNPCLVGCVINLSSGEWMYAAAHGMYPGPGQGARTAFEDAHQLSVIVQEALASSAPETAISEAVTR